jgi:hypothetical protein
LYQQASKRYANLSHGKLLLDENPFHKQGRKVKGQQPIIDPFLSWLNHLFSLPSATAVTASTYQTKAFDALQISGTAKLKN